MMIVCVRFCIQLGREWTMVILSDLFVILLTACMCSRNLHGFRKPYRFALEKIEKLC